MNSAVPKMREVEGLRALAILAVLGFHAGLGLPGGFVGVDVFFVLSGFLITTLLLSEHDMTGRVSLVGFYARRARRLLPLAGVVIAAVLVAARVWTDQITSSSTGFDAAWASLFAANVRFARLGTDYLTATDTPSAVQHFWSLAVEEQFYLVWPAVLALVWKIGRNHLRATMWLAGSVTAASFAACMWMAERYQVWAFFSLPSRAWELAAGALLAVALRYVWISVRTVAPWVGLGVLGMTVLCMPQNTSFPGPLALIPVAATLAVLCSINTGTAVARALSHPLLQWIGSRSYALYLWHWPVLVFAEYRWGALEITERLGAVALSFALAELSHRIVESPVRHARALVRRPRLSVALGLLLAVSTASGAVALGHHDPDAPSGHTPRPAAPTTSTTAKPAPTTTTEPPRYSARQLAAYISGPHRAQLLADLSQSSVPTDLTPSLSSAFKDVPVPFTNGCLAPGNATENPSCFAGRPSRPVEVVLFGDSKAAQWFPGMWKAAKRANWRVSVITKASCPAAMMNVKTSGGDEYVTCNTWRTKAIQRINDSKATIVVISSNWYAASYGERSWSAALARTVDAFIKGGKKVVIFSNTPVWQQRPAVCAAKNKTTLQNCSQLATAVTSQDRNDAEEAVAERTGALFFDVTRWLCTDTCPVISGTTMMYMDAMHLSATMSEALDEPLELAIRSAIETR